VDHQVPASTYKGPAPVSYGPPARAVADPPHDQPAVYGAYLGRIAHCVQCHTPIGADGRRDYANRTGAGGLPIDTVAGSRISANITSDPETGIGRWSDAQVVAAISHGMRPDGSPLAPMMPWPYWQAMKAPDLKAIVAWLRTLEPVSNAVLR
jgi:mono/diheme cytochrome c family protein